MSRSLLVVLLVLAAGSSAQRPSRPGPLGPPQSVSPCLSSLAPTAEEREKLRSAFETCIAEEDGLQDIINELRTPVFGGKMRGGRNHDVAALLEDNDYPTEATTLRECIAREMGMLAADGTFDMDVLKTTISGKVSGLSVEANTQLGLDNCPDVDGFDVPEYLKCIIAYCETGAPPLTIYG